jgi:hypothetical protein
MGWIANVTAGDLTQSVWGNNIRDRVTILFANQAERDTHWPAALPPPAGARCVLATAPGLTQVWNGTFWEVQTRLITAVITTSAAGAANVGYGAVYPYVPSVVAASGDSDIPGIISDVTQQTSNSSTSSAHIMVRDFAGAAIANTVMRVNIVIGGGKLRD